MTQEKKREVAKTGGSSVAAAPKEALVENTLAKINGMIDTQGIRLPEGYNAGNALRKAHLILLETRTKEKRPVLEACTPASIAFALLNMALQGLDPAKNQCYFIAYGDKLACQKSYFGSMQQAKEADPLIDRITFLAVYEGEKFSFSAVNGEYVIEHEPSLKAMGSGKVSAAYCLMLDKDGKVRHSDVMGIEQIKKAWGMSKMKPVDSSGKIRPDSTHGKFTGDMAIKTVVNHACKYVVNSSGDPRLKSATESGEQAIAKMSADESARLKENNKVIDITTGEMEPDADKEEAVEESVKESVPAGDQGNGDVEKRDPGF